MVAREAPAYRERAVAGVRDARSDGALRGPIALLVKNFQYGGTQRVLSRLANKLHDFGHTVHVLSPASGPLRSSLRDRLEVVSLDATNHFYSRALAFRADPSLDKGFLLPLVLPLHTLGGLPVLGTLSDYLRRVQPSVLITATPSYNVVAPLAKRLAGTATALVVTEHVTANRRRASERKWSRRYLPDLMRRTYGDADAIVGVSNAVASDLRELLQVPEGRVRCIYNPAVPDEVQRLAAAPVDHPWFQPGQPPVVLTSGRPSDVKDFPMLLRAFARLRLDARARLVILSSAKPMTRESQHLDDLRDLARSLGFAQDFEIHDFTPNPFAFMARAGVFASSSISEGFGNVLAESLACGCPVVSTRTGGAVEVLRNGRYGRLVAIGDDAQMAAALRDALAAPRNSESLVRAAADFSEERSARAYEALCFEVAATAQALAD
jgi:glycosyltransferase involved in cell wall biosynthesis